MTFVLPSIGGGIIASPTSAPPAWNGNTYSVDFDGSNDYVDCGTVSALNSASTFSVSAWYKKSSAGAGGLIVGGQPYPSREFYIEHFSNNNIYVGYDSSFASVSSTSDTNWHHIVYVRDSGTHKLYLDGSDMSLGGTPSSTTGASAGQTFSIGNLRNYSGYFGGVIDEVAVFSSALSASNVTAIYNSGEPTDLSSYSPVHWWRMGDNDGGTGITITDQGSEGNDGTLTNGPTFSTDVPTAPPFSNTYSVDFDGTDDYMVISQDSSINITGDLTLSAWINLDSLGAFQGIITKRSSTTNYQFYIRSTNVLSFFDGSNLANDNTALTTGSWIHVAVVVSGSSASFYRDGSFSSTSSGISVSSNTANLTIGDIVGGSFLNGKVDEVSVFDSALSASDITAIYNSGAPADLTSYSPVGWWRMGDNDGGTGTTITDQGSGGNDGTLTNGPTFSTTVP
jgi:hypothetical protein